MKMTTVLQRLVWFCTGALLIVLGTVAGIYALDREAQNDFSSLGVVLRAARISARLAAEADAAIRVHFATAQQGSLAAEVIDRAPLFAMVDSLGKLVKDDADQAARVRAISAALKSWDAKIVASIVSGSTSYQTALAEKQSYAVVQARFEDFRAAAPVEFEEGESRVRDAQLLGTAAVLVEFLAFLGTLLVVIRVTLMRDATELSRRQHLLEEQATELEMKVEEVESANSSLNDALTETARKDEELRASVQRRDEAAALLDSALSSSPVGFSFWDSDLRYIRITHALAAERGLLPEDFIGRTMAEVIPEIAVTAQPVLERVLRTGIAVRDIQMVVDGTGKNGGPQHLLVTSYPVTTSDGKILGVGAVISDVTEAHAREEELRKSEERYRYVSLATNDAVWDWDLKMGTIEWNDGIAELFGYDPRDVSSDVTW